LTWSTAAKIKVDVGFCCPAWTELGKCSSRFWRNWPESVDRIVVSYPTDRPLGYSELETLVEAALPALDRSFCWGNRFPAIGIEHRGDWSSTNWRHCFGRGFRNGHSSKFGKWLRHLVGTWMFSFSLAKMGDSQIPDRQRRTARS